MRSMEASGVMPSEAPSRTMVKEGQAPRCEIKATPDEPAVMDLGRDGKRMVHDLWISICGEQEGEQGPRRRTSQVTQATVVERRS